MADGEGTRKLPSWESSSTVRIAISYGATGHDVSAVSPLLSIPGPRAIRQGTLATTPVRAKEVVLLVGDSKQ